MATFRLASAPGYGHNQIGIYATSAIPVGDIIVSEKPMLSLQSARSPTAVTRLRTKLLNDINTLSIAELERLTTLSYRVGEAREAAEVNNFINLACPAEETTKAFELLVQKAFLAYSFPSLEYEEVETYRLFGQLCFLNHSWKPNAALVWEAEDQEMDLRATVEINTEEEIVIPYIAEPFQSRARRQRELGFDCKCCVCSGANPAVEALHQELCACCTLLKASRSSFPNVPMPNNFRNADDAYINALATAAGPRGGLQMVADELWSAVERSSVRHISLASIFELLSDVSLAWLLTRRTDAGRHKFHDRAVIAKVKELGILCVYLGGQDEGMKKSMQQFWHMLASYERREEAFCALLAGQGIVAEIRDGQVGLKFKQ